MEEEEEGDFHFFFPLLEANLLQVPHFSTDTVKCALLSWRRRKGMFPSRHPATARSEFSTSQRGGQTVSSPALKHDTHTHRRWPHNKKPSTSDKSGNASQPWGRKEDFLLSDSMSCSWPVRGEKVVYGFSLANVEKVRTQSWGRMFCSH